MKKLSIWHWLVIAGTMVVGIALGLGFYTSIDQKGIGSGEAAAWLQAIASVAAIVVAFMVVTLQHRWEVERQAEAERAEAYRLISLSVEFAHDAWQCMARIEKFRGNALNTETGSHRAEQRRELEEILEATLVIPAERLATVEAARQVVIVRSNLRRALDEIESGPVRGHVHVGCGEHYGYKIKPIVMSLQRAHELLREEAYAFLDS